MAKASVRHVVVGSGDSLREFISIDLAIGARSQVLTIEEAESLWLELPQVIRLAKLARDAAHQREASRKQERERRVAK